MFTSVISSIVRHGVSKSAGLAKTTAATCARDTATLMRFREKRKAMSLGSSPPLEVVIETRQIGAS